MEPPITRTWNRSRFKGTTVFRPRHISASLCAIFIAVTMISGCSDLNNLVDTDKDQTGLPPTTTPAVSSVATQSATNATPAGAENALATLSGLAVKGRAPKTGYSRAQFGEAWTDDVDVEEGRNGCDGRNDILQRDLVNITFKPGANDCTVLSGTLHDPYTGRTIPFVRGKNTSSDVQIDHVVALSNGWQTGAQQLTAQERKNFANDPRNLQATDGPTNQQKSDGDAATWLVPNKAYRCTYVARQVDVKAAYRLWVTPPEKAAIERVLTNC